MHPRRKRRSAVDHENDRLSPAGRRYSAGFAGDLCRAQQLYAKGSPAASELGPVSPELALVDPATPEYVWMISKRTKRQSTKPTVSAKLVVDERPR